MRNVPSDRALETNIMPLELASDPLLARHRLTLRKIGAYAFVHNRCATITKTIATTVYLECFSAKIHLTVWTVFDHANTNNADY